MYQNVLASRNAWHATLFQYACALGIDAVASPSVSPDTGLHSVNQSRRDWKSSLIPSSLSDPHFRSRLDLFDDSPDVIHRLPKHLGATGDATVLPVRVPVRAHEVAGFDDLTVNVSV